MPHADPAERAAYLKRYRQTPRARELKAASRRRTRAAEAERSRRKRAANPELYRAHTQRHRAANPELTRERRRMWQAARRARKRGQFVEHVDPSVVFERDEGVCGICGDGVDPSDFHVDHIVALANGGLHGYCNVQLAHPPCNLRKAAK